MVPTPVIQTHECKSMNQPDNQDPTIPQANVGDPGTLPDAAVSLASVADAQPAVRQDRRPARKVTGTATRFDEVVTGQFDADEEDVALEAPN